MTQTIATFQYFDTMQERPNYIDYAKVIGIYCVLIGHFVYFYDIPFSEHSTIWTITHFVTLFHMPLFFFISGMLFNYNSGNILVFVKKQWTTLLFPYLLYCIMLGGVYYLVEVYNGASFMKILWYLIGIVTGGDLFKKATLYPVGPIWFVYSLFLIKMLMVLVQNITNGRIRKLILSIIVVLGFVVLMLNRDILPFRLDSSLIGFFFFWIGLSSKHLVQNIFRKDLNTCVILFASGLLLLVSYQFNLDNSIRQGLSINVCYFGEYPWLFLLSGLAGTTFVLSLSRLISMIKFSRWTPILVLSNGMIAVLAIHKVLFFILKHLYYNDTVIGMFVISVLVLLISYVFILIIRRYFPILIGNRQVSGRGQLK